jgi:hypothetical protein
MTNTHTYAVCGAHTVFAWIWIISGELVQLTSEMFSSPRVIVPVGVNSMSSNKISTFVGTITTISAVGTIIVIVTPAVTSRMPMYVTYLAGGIDVGRGTTVAATTTIIAAATIIIIATWAIIAVLLAWAVLVPPIIIARPIILAGATIVVAGALLRTRAAIIIAWTGVTASHVCRGGEPRLVSLVLPIKSLNLSEKISKGSVGVGIDGSTKIVVVTSEALHDIVDELIIIKRFAHGGEFSGDALHLGNIFFSGQITFARVIESRAKLLDASLGLA